MKMHLLISIFYYLGVMLSCSVCSCAEQTKIPATNGIKVEEQKEKKKFSLVGLSARLLMGKRVGDKLFYSPTQDVVRTPEHYRFKYENVFFKSADKTKLHGWFIPSEVGAMKAKGTIVFSHGNFGNVSYHIDFVNGMVEEGYNVFLYDYRGFGKSAGKAKKKGIIADAEAAFRYVKTRKDIDQNRIVSIGHSLGGAKSIAALAVFQPKGLRGIVIMSTFSSYRKIALKMAGNLANYVVSDTHNPKNLVKKLPKVPLLVMHAENDELIPYEHGVEIYEAANHPKTLMKAKGGHNDILSVNQKKNEKDLLKWLEKIMK